MNGFQNEILEKSNKKLQAKKEHFDGLSEINFKSIKMPVKA